LAAKRTLAILSIFIEFKISRHHRLKLLQTFKAHYGVQRNARLNALPNIALQTHARLWRWVNILQRDACDRLAQHVNIVTATSARFVALFNRKEGRGSLKSYYDTPS
jgi:hypothetical protein